MFVHMCVSIYIYIYIYLPYARIMCISLSVDDVHTKLLMIDDNLLELDRFLLPQASWILSNLPFDLLYLTWFSF